jgi:hypothetical protein
MDAFEFSRYAIKACSKYSFIKYIEIQTLDEPVVKIRAEMDGGVFAGIFYNAETLKYSFALIKYGKRIFGIDNARNWHVHPFENPEEHLRTTETSLPDFLEIVASNKDKWRLF